MFREELAGTYWYCMNDDSSTSLIRSDDKPEPYCGGFYVQEFSKMKWLRIRDRSGKIANSKSMLVAEKIGLESSDFADVKFPEITHEDGPIEIEITKSGKVYTY